eukprot:gene12452-13739_t
MADSLGSGSSGSNSEKKRLENKYSKLTSQLRESFDKVKGKDKSRRGGRSRSLTASGVVDKVTGPNASEEKQVAVYGVGNTDKARLLYNKRQRQWYEARKQLPKTRKEERPQSSAIVVQTFGDDDDSDADACNSDDHTDNEAPVHGSLQYPDKTSRNLADLEQELETLTEECRDALSVGDKIKEGSRTWKERMEALEESWSCKREELFDVVLECETRHAMVCEMGCGREALIECRDCERWGYSLCELCDAVKHKSRPFHNRKGLKDGFLQNLSPSKFFQETTRDIVVKVENISTIIEVEVLEFWNAFQKLQPNSAESCFLRVLEDLSGNFDRISSINRSIFARALKSGSTAIRIG